MKNLLKEAGKLVAHRKSIVYGLAALFGTIVHVVYFIVQGSEDWTILDVVAIETTIAISGTTMQLLSGTGIMLTYATLVSIVFTLTSDFLRAKPNRVRALKILLLIPIILIAGYGIHIFYTTVFAAQELGLLARLTAIYGVWSLLLMVYVIPAIRDSYLHEFDRTIPAKIKEKLEGARFSIWRSYQHGVWKEYGKVEAKEAERYKIQLLRTRNQLSGYLLFPLSIMLLQFPTLAFLGFALWLRIFSLDHEAFSKAERALLVILVLAVIILRSLIFFVFPADFMLLYFETAYSIGIFVSIFVLAAIILKS